MTLIEQSLVALALVAGALGLAYLLIKRKRTALAFLVGLPLFAAFQFYLRRALEISIQDCIERVCASGGLPPGCLEAEFGCTEWSGLSVAIFYLTGIAQLVLFWLGTGIIALIAHRRRRARASQPEVDRQPSPGTGGGSG